MTRYRYNQQIKPAAPFVHVALERPDGGTVLETQPAQIDTGADMTVVPSALLDQLDFVQFDAIEPSVVSAKRSRPSWPG